MWRKVPEFKVREEGRSEKGDFPYEPGFGEVTIHAILGTLMFKGQLTIQVEMSSEQLER